MSRPVQEGGYVCVHSLTPAVKLLALRVFLTAEAAGGNPTALYLLHLLRGMPGTVEA